MTKLPPKSSTASAATFSKDFEYLIRRELDKSDHEHPASALQRNSILYLNTVKPLYSEHHWDLPKSVH